MNPNAVNSQLDLSILPFWGVIVGLFQLVLYEELGNLWRLAFSPRKHLGVDSLLLTSSKGRGWSLLSRCYLFKGAEETTSFFIVTKQEWCDILFYLFLEWSELCILQSEGTVVLAWIFCWEKMEKDVEGCSLMVDVDSLEGEK